LPINTDSKTSLNITSCVSAICYFKLKLFYWLQYGFRGLLLESLCGLVIDNCSCQVRYRYQVLAICYLLIMIMKVNLY